MNLYLDTSSLVKLYVEEEGSDGVRLLVGEAEWVASSVLSYPEGRSAFARQVREDRLSPEGQKQAREDLDRDWSHLVVLDLVEPIWRQAAVLAETHALRALDSLHLASYLFLVQQNPSASIRFSCFDERLSQAARLASADVG